MTTDAEWMALALAEAEKGLGRTTPNPAVGALLVQGDQRIASGYHAKAGTDHAEVAALRQVNFSAPGLTLYSTLEPCNHHGRTGPCTEAIISAGISRVVIGAPDPNPLVSGRGIARLRAAGLEVITGVLEAECAALNEAFNHAIVHQRPFITLKLATSLDGRISTRTGQSQWITSPEARQKAHQLRDKADVILVGSGTVLADNPRLTTRLPGGHNPLRVVLDSQLRTPLDSHLAQTQDAPTLIFCDFSAPAAHRVALEKRGVEVIPVQSAQARLELASVFSVLTDKEKNSVLVEGGATVAGCLVDGGWVQRLALFMAPIIIGGQGAPAAVGGLGADTLADALLLAPPTVERVGPDLYLSALVLGRRG